MPSIDLQALHHRVLVCGFLVCVLFGYVIQRSRFCTMGALSDWFNLRDSQRLRMWALALGLSIIGFQTMVLQGAINPLKTIYATGPILWLSALVGGVLFGIGMVLASGCGSKTLARIGSGSIKALVVMMVMGLCALATMRGVTAVFRHHTFDTHTWSPAWGNTLSAWVDSGLAAAGSSTGPGLSLGIGLILVAAAFYRRPRLSGTALAGGFGVAACVLALWWISGHMGYVAEHPEILESVYVATQSGRMESLSFSAPMALHLDWLLYFSDTHKTLNLSVVSVWGVVLGAWVFARQDQSFSWEGFRDTQDLVLHLMGGALMGVGGVTAMGCTVGHGLSGLSTLSVVSFLAMCGIVFGAWLGFKLQCALLERKP